ncbi:oligosaccharide repeat unit polymerase [Ramlibacter sp. WS9]|uniref:oligosaccharide repeat unit polymerase n=1 Tax=Ramlibacter sp. WS9 TaxID=1882741 RepID=UPI0011430185|nr:oligosaccharide repeat unit polymerase [Ramlibacter sp. WS9]ROZ66355.1 hypothetical protein EEB15_26455 [Ramlibacter sp. WS9]
MIALVVMMRRSRVGSVGLPFAYLVGWALIHLPGASLYLLPDHNYYQLESIVDGFGLTTLGLATYCLGVFLVRPGANSDRGRAPGPGFAAARPLHRIAMLFLGIGLAVQLVVIPFVGQIASLTALTSGLATLSVAGACLGLHDAFMKKNNRRLIFWLAVAATFPVITLTSAAFLGFGTYSLVVVVAFGLMNIPRRTLYIAAVLAVPVVYLGMSLYVTYMRDRTDLREMIWMGDAGIASKMDRVTKLVTDFELLDIENNDHLVAIDQRLNQNHLVGSAVGYMKDGLRDFTHGESVLLAFVALVPRALWPDKPTFGGSGNMVAEFTGLTFSEGTSVGVGQVLEFYINFGAWGVAFGFLLLGVLIRQFDWHAAQGLRNGDYRRFVMWFVPGLGMLQAGGNLAEVTASTAAAIGAALLASRLIERRAVKPGQPDSQSAVNRP